VSEQLITALRAAVAQMTAQRKALRYAQVLCRVWPEGLAFSCHIVPRDVRDEPIPEACPVENLFGIARQVVLDATSLEKVTWDQLATFDADAARAVVDRICAKAHELLDPLLGNAPAEPKRATA